MADTIFKKPILIFSKYCKYSHNFLQILIKHPELYDSFIRMNIDINPTTKKRPDMFYKIQQMLNRKISKVPTIITPGAEHILSDQDAFKWLEFQINHLNKQMSKEAGLTPFNPNEMISFSDNYAKYDKSGSTDLNDANEQSYKFYVNKQLPNDNYLRTDKTWAPNSDKTNGFLNDLESSTQNIDYNSLQSERQYFDDHQQKQRSVIGNMNFKDNNSQGKINTQDINSFSKNRQQPIISRQSINFTDPSFGLSGKFGANNKMSLKTKDLDDKLSSLQKDREMMDNTLQQRRQY
jgi:hypothetical protein